MPEQTRRRAFVVLGMHRSGTSALTRVLSLCGARLPSHLMQSADADTADVNAEVGYWESRALYDLHEELLAAAGSSWDDPHELPDGWFESPAASQWTQRLVSTLEAEYADSPVVVAKDPRISRLVPIWKNALQRLGMDAYWIISVRNPNDIAASLSRRNFFDPAKSLLLWLTHFLPAERHTRDTSRLFVGYDDLLDDWHAVISRVEQAFGFTFAERDGGSAEINRFLDRDLRHHTTPISEVLANDEFAACLKEAYRWALEAAAGDEPDGQRLDRVAQEYDSARRLYGSALSAAESGSEKKLFAQRKLGQQLDYLEGVVRDYLDVSESRFTQFNASLGELQKGLSWLRDHGDGQYQGLTSVIDGASRATQAVAAETRRLEERVAELADSFERRFDELSRQSEELSRRGDEAQRSVDELRQSVADASRTATEETNRQLDELRANLESHARRLEADRQISNAVLRLAIARHASPPTRDLLLNRHCGLLGLVVNFPGWLITGKARARLDRWRHMRRIVRSGLFDPTYYLARYPDIAHVGIDPLVHYVDWGAREGRHPNACLDPDHATDMPPHAADPGSNPRHHDVEYWMGRSNPPETSVE